MRLRTTHTVAMLTISKAAYDEIRERLEKAGYTHTFMPDGVIDMTGIGLAPREPEPEKAAP